MLALEDKHQHRARNAKRIARLPNTSTKIAAVRQLPQDHQTSTVTAMLINAKASLAQAIAEHNVSRLAESKATAATLREIVKQMRLGKDMQLDAAEFTRRAERALGVGIREGQVRGEIRRQGQGSHSTSSTVEQVSPNEYAPQSELHGKHGGEGIYAMTDGVSDKDFEEALAEARATGNLSRANVARKCRAKVVELEPEPEPVESVRKTTQARNMMNDLVIQINSLVFTVNDTNPDEVDYSKHKADIHEMFCGLKTIRAFLNKVKEQR